MINNGQCPSSGAFRIIRCKNKNDNEKLKEDEPKETEKVVETAKPKPTEKATKDNSSTNGTTQKSSNTGSSSKSSTPKTDTSKPSTDTKKTDADKKTDSPLDILRERGENIREDVRDATENFFGAMKDIGDQFTGGGNGGGIIRTPSEFADDVRDFMGNITGQTGR